MRNRLSAIAAAVTAGLLVTGISWAASDTETNLSLEANQDMEIPVEDAGTVHLGNQGSTLIILSAVANPGFEVEVEVPEGREVEADFRGDGRRLQFNAELEDGVVRVRIRTEAEASSTVTVIDTSTTSPTSTSTTQTTTAPSTTATTSTTIDDHGDDDDDDTLIELPIGPVTYDVSGAASVTVIFSLDGHLQLGLISPASGWTVEETRQESDEVEVRLRSGEEEARLRVRVDDGQVRVEIERKD
jgi:hypothetical protein